MTVIVCFVLPQASEKGNSEINLNGQKSNVTKAVRRL